MQFSFWVRQPYADVLRRSLADGRRHSFQVLEFALERAYAKPWVAYYDVRLRLLDRAPLADGMPREEQRTLRLRLAQSGQMFVVIDAVDTALGRWLVGEAPQFSALALEPDVKNGVAWHLVAETKVRGGVAGGWQPQDPTPFERYHSGTIADLDAAYTRARSSPAGLTTSRRRSSPSTRPRISATASSRSRSRRASSSRTHADSARSR